MTGGGKDGSNPDVGPRHRRVSSSPLTQLLRPLYPGQFHQVKLNLYNIVTAIDFAQPRHLHFLSGMVSVIISRNYPFRWGWVPVLDGSPESELDFRMNPV